MLVVDHNHSTRSQIRRVHEEWGYHVLGEAASAEEAKQIILKRGWPNVIIIDIMYPKLEGLSLVTAIHKRKLPVATVVMGESTDPSYIRQALRHGAIDYLVKPLCYEELRHALNQAMNVIKQHHTQHRQLHRIHLFFERLKQLSPSEILKEQSHILSDIFYLQEKLKGEIQGLLYIMSAKWEQALVEENVHVHIRLNNNHWEDMMMYFRQIAEIWIKNVKPHTRKDLPFTIKRICDYVHKNYNCPITLSNVCEQFNVSTSYFSKRFKEQTGYTFIQYVNQIRIDKAKELLLQSNRAIGEIAKKSGFPTIQYFNRTFKREVECTPNEYRQKFGM